MVGAPLTCWETESPCVYFCVFWKPEKHEDLTVISKVNMYIFPSCIQASARTKDISDFMSYSKVYLKALHCK